MVAALGRLAPLSVLARKPHCGVVAGGGRGHGRLGPRHAAGKRQAERQQKAEHQQPGGKAEAGMKGSALKAGTRHADRDASAPPKIKRAGAKRLFAPRLLYPAAPYPFPLGPLPNS